jgi:hypothetical protein
MRGSGLIESPRDTAHDLVIGGSFDKRKPESYQFLVRRDRGGDSPGDAEAGAAGGQPGTTLACSK